MKKILITGAEGFVGASVVNALIAKNGAIVTVSRNLLQKNGVYKSIALDDIRMLSSELLAEMATIDTVIHAAARVHMMKDTSGSPLEDFKGVNTLATLSLARLAAESGVQRFIFISSIKVNGEITEAGHPFSPDDLYVPDDPYGLSKYEAERGLLALANEMGMEVVIIRPPLVYGPEVRANFASMMKWMNRSIPLPFGSIHNQRSLVALDNLVDFIALCADRKNSPQAANQIFLISDGEDVSTTQLLRKVAKALNKRAWLIPVPVFFMTWGAKLLGKGEVANRLFGSLQVDSAKARNLLGWQPVTTMDEQLKKTADAFLNHLNSAADK